MRSLTSPFLRALRAGVGHSGTWPVGAFGAERKASYAASAITQPPPGISRPSVTSTRGIPSWPR